MKLYLVRHAEAGAKEVDPQRNLTDEGRRDAQRLARLIEPRNLCVSAIWHSGKPRAAQTAELIAPAISAGGCAEMTARPGLAPYDRVKPVAKEIERLNLDLMIVGHEPFLGRLASRLVVGRASVPIIQLEKPAIVCLARDQAGQWRVIWMLSPTLPASPAAGQEDEPSTEAPENPDGLN